jgi:RHS repeat-associated protein
MYSYVTASPTGTVYVVQESEPGSNGVLTYNFSFIWYSQEFGYNSSTYGNDIACQIFNNNPVYDNYELGAVFNAVSDTSLRLVAYITNNPDMGLPWGVEQKTYDANNNLIEDLGVNTVDKKYTYGQVGNVLTSWFNGYPAQSSTTYYNASQYFQKQSETDMDGHTTSYGVGTNTAGNTGDPDPNIGDRNQVLWVKDAGYADPASPSYAKEYVNTFNQYGQKLASTNLKGVVTQNAYGTANDTVDGYYDLGNLVQVIQDPGTGHLNRTTSMHYDAAGRVIQSTDPMGQTTYFTYNVLGQPVTVQTPTRGSARAETISYTYEADGRTQTVTDNRGTTSITYEDEHYNDYTNYGGRVYSVTDPITGTISYSYLLTGEKNTETLPSGRVWSYYYEGEPNPPGEFNGQMGSGCYYMLPKDDPNSLVRWLLCITDNQGRTVNIVHDAIGVSSCVQYNLVFNKYGATVATDDMQDVYDDGYIAEGDEGVTYPTQALSRGNLAQRTTISYQMQSSGTVVAQMLCNNSYTYDNASNRLTNSVSVATVNSSGAVQYTGGSPTYGVGVYPAWLPGWLGHQVNCTVPNFFEDQYGLPQVTNQLYTTRTENYTYDDLNRLSTVSYGDGESQTYSFDSMGNRLGKTDTITPQSGSPTTTTTAYTFDAANRITGLSTNGGTATAITSDADGNTLTDESGRTYTWDSQNRMTSCTYNGTTTTFTYGSDGLRRSMTLNGVTTYYAYDGTTLIQEFQTNIQTGNLDVTTTYMTGPMGPICRINETQQTEGYYPPGVTSNAPLGRGVTRWYVYDGLGSKIAELDDNNNMTTSGQYDVYGAPRAGTQQGIAANSSQGYVGSLGHMTDASTGGLIYMQARYYDPAIGRLISEDPKKQGSSWFAYCGNDPVNKIDANGKTSSGVQFWTNFWQQIAGMLVMCAYANGGFAWSNIQAGYAAMKAGQGLQITGQNYLSIGGLAIGSAMTVIGQAIEDAGSNQMMGGILGAITGALELFAAGIIMAYGEELGEGTNDDMAEAALSMAAQPIG